LGLVEGVVKLQSGHRNLRNHHNVVAV